jgi:hypothetical protein
MESIEPEEGESPSSRTAVLRRAWIADIASVLQTTKTDDIAEDAMDRGTERSIRVAKLQTKSDAIEQNLESTPPPPAQPNPRVGGDSATPQSPGVQPAAPEVRASSSGSTRAAIVSPGPTRASGSSSSGPQRIPAAVLAEPLVTDTVAPKTQDPGPRSELLGKKRVPAFVGLIVLGLLIGIAVAFALSR